MGARVSATQPVQVTASDDTSVLKVTLYARPPCPVAPCEEEARVGSSTVGSNSEPFLVNWYTLNTPNNMDVEILAEAEDEVRNTSMSDPVLVTIQNTQSPNVFYIAGFTVWPDDSANTRLTRQQSVSSLDLSTVKAPQNWKQAAQVQPQAEDPCKSLKCRYAIEWAWASLPGATAYRPMWSQNAAGDYQRVIESQDLAVGPGDKQFYYKPLSAPEKRYGAVKPLISNADGALSNAKKAEYLPLQETTEPTQEQVVTGGRPTLKWKPTEGAGGYTYRILDRHPDDSGAQVKWTNGSNATTSTSATFPDQQAALPSGTYYYQVMAYKFRDDRSVSGVSFSTPVRFVVP